MNQITELYIAGKSINELCEIYKLGKLKIKSIITLDGIEIRKKGGVTKNFSVVKKDLSEFSIKCKQCEKIFINVDNKNGSIIEHIKNCYPNIDILSSFKRRAYLQNTGMPWHLNYFDLIPKIHKEFLNCKICNWKTNDLKNITGSLTKHIVNNHFSISEYVNKYPSEIYLFSNYNKFVERDKLFKDSDNFVLCEICKEPFKTISNTHLSLHGLNTDEYVKLYGNNSLVSRNKKIEYLNNLNNLNNSSYIPKYRSEDEIEIEEFIKSLGINYIICDKKILNGAELDIYLPDFNIAIEYNGLYWHSEKQGKHKNYHLDKTNLCIKNNIRLIHIFSDEWRTKKTIIKDRILNLLGMKVNKIYARKCKIVILTKDEKSNFLNNYHLQGNDKSTIYLGLKYNNELVSLITFGKLRKILGNKINNIDEYEIYRYCSLNVIGGFSKLLNYFIKTYNPNKIITYSDRNWSPSNEHCFYGKIGFEYLGVTKPNYWYTKKYTKREHRYNFRKNKLIELGFDKTKTENQIMYELGYDRIWDTGNLKFVYNKKGE
jgi:hypothetical protein